MSLFSVSSSVLFTCDDILCLFVFLRTLTPYPYLSLTTFFPVYLFLQRNFILFLFFTTQCLDRIKHSLSFFLFTLTFLSVCISDSLLIVVIKILLCHSFFFHLMLFFLFVHKIIYFKLFFVFILIYFFLYCSICSKYLSLCSFVLLFILFFPFCRLKCYFNLSNVRRIVQKVWEHLTLSHEQKMAIFIVIWSFLYMWQ